MATISISEAANLIGVTPATLRRWEREGKLVPDHRTLGNHRRYRLDSLAQRFKLTRLQPRKTILYARVSCHDQSDDLGRQAKRLQAWADAEGHEAECLEDLGSGLNYKKRGLKRLLGLITTGQVERLVLTHKDRLLRFGSELIFQLCKAFGTQVIVLDDFKALSFEQQLAMDVLEIVTVFSAKLYGRRSHENRKTAPKQPAG